MGFRTHMNIENWDKTAVIVNNIEHISIINNNERMFEGHIPAQKVSIVLQDDEQTLKIFARPLGTMLNDGSEATVKTLTAGEEITLPKVSRVRIVSFWVPFEKYDVYKNGCVVKISGQRILIKEK